MDIIIVSIVSILAFAGILATEYHAYVTAREINPNKGRRSSDNVA